MGGALGTVSPPKENKMELTTTAVTSAHNHGDFDGFVRKISDRFARIETPVFETDAAGLYQAYLNSFADPVERQYHTCSCCRAFIERFGHLATVGDNGQLESIWNAEDAPEHYKAGVEAMARLVRRAALTIPFLSSEKMYGTPNSGRRDDGGEWTHFAIKPRADHVFRGTVLKSAFQAASEKREELSSVLMALGEYDKATCETALRLLKNDQLGNSAAVVGQAEFLVALHDARESLRADQRAKKNLIYRLVVAAPSGFCHPRSSMIATLLDDIQAGLSFEDAQRRWNAKMHPLQYQRPQAAPTAGAIAGAEKAFQALGAASALERRFATLEDVAEKLWSPKSPVASGSAGIFSGVQAKNTFAGNSAMRVPAVTMTWDKFARTVLPTADALECYTPQASLPFVALTTAVHEDALPILQWDSEDQRNPVAWYLYNGGSSPRTFNLEGGEYHRVTAVTAKPPMWHGGDFPHQGIGVILLLEGAKDTRGSSSAAVFPSTLKSEFRPFASTIEAFSQGSRVQDMGGAHAAGLLLEQSRGADVRLRVTTGGQVSEYKIDRWD